MKTLTVDDLQRIRLPNAKPRTKFAYEESGNGRITLTELVEKEERPAKVRFEKRDGYTVGVSDRPITMDSIKEALADFPP